MCVSLKLINDKALAGVIRGRSSQRDKCLREGESVTPEKTETSA